MNKNFVDRKIVNNTIIDTLLILGIGVLCHFPALSNDIVNHDSVLLFGNDARWLITQGKWFVTPLSSVEGPINIPYLAMIIGLIAIAASAVVICETFDVVSRECRILVGFLLVAFPSTAAFSLYQSEDYFGLTFLGASISAWLLIKGKNRKYSFVGIIILTLVMGAYQAYLGVTITLLVFDCLKKLLLNQPWKSILKRGLFYIGEIVTSGILYLIILKIALKVSDAELSSYKGMNSFSSNLKPDNLLRSIYGAYKAVYSFFIKNCFGVFNDRTSLLIISFIVVVVCICIFKAYKTGALSNVGNIVLGSILIMLIPMTINAIGVLAANQSFYYISIYAFVLPFLFFVLLCGDDCIGVIFDSIEKKVNVEMAIYVIAGLMMFCIGINWTIQNNAVYDKINLYNKEFDAKLTMLASRIQGTKGYRTENEVFFVGNAPYAFLESIGELGTIEEIIKSDGYGFRNSEDEIYNEGVLGAYFQNVLSIQLNQIPSEEYKNKSVLRDMPIYPSDGSIIIDGNKVVVKLGEI